MSNRRWSFIKTGRGHEHASDDVATLEEWWQRWPAAHAAVLTTNRPLVLDADVGRGVDGRESVRELEERYGALRRAHRANAKWW